MKEDPSPMKNFRSLTLGTLAALALTSFGCGTTGMTLPGMMGANSSSYEAQAHHTATGIRHTLGYNVARYETLQAPHAQLHRIPRAGQLPTAVDNRQFCSPVADQGQLGSCTAFSMVKGLREYLQRKEGQTQIALSPLFFYYQERVIEGSVSQDSGATITDGMTVLKNTGTCPETDDPYNIAKFTVKPSPKAVADAGVGKVQSTTQLATLDDVKTALAQGHAVSLGFTVYSSFENIGANGVMPMPGKGEQIIGGHAVLAVGYDDAKQVLIVRNSWGPSWGDQGYFYMPYAYTAAKNAGQPLVSEWWTAQ
jgi:C1A family cysteine protease